MTKEAVGNYEEGEESQKGFDQRLGVLEKSVASLAGKEYEDVLPKGLAEKFRSVVDALRGASIKEHPVAMMTLKWVEQRMVFVNELVDSFRLQEIEVKRNEAEMTSCLDRTSLCNHLLVLDFDMPLERQKAETELVGEYRTLIAGIKDRQGAIQGELSGLMPAIDDQLAKVEKFVN